MKAEGKLHGPGRSGGSRALSALLAAAVITMSSTGVTVALGPSPTRDLVGELEALGPVAAALGASKELEAGRLAGAVTAALGRDAAPGPLAAPPDLPAGSHAFLAALPAGLQTPVRVLLDAVLEASALGASGGPGARQGAVVVLQGIEAALPALRAHAAGHDNLAPRRAPPDLHGFLAALEEATGQRGQLLQGRPPAEPATDAWGLGVGGLQGPEAAGEAASDGVPGVQAAERAVRAAERFLAVLHDFRGSFDPGADHPDDPLAGCHQFQDILRVCNEPPSAWPVCHTVPVMLHIDLAGSDCYRYGAGRADGPGAVQVVLDLEGSDGYASVGAGQGAGLRGGIGILVDLEGDDRYLVEGYSLAWGRINEGPALGQGFGDAGGVGVLADLDGNDTYALLDYEARFGGGWWWGAAMEAEADEAEVKGQGAAELRGAGLLLDRVGSDSYTAMAYSHAAIYDSPWSSPREPQVVRKEAHAGPGFAMAQGAAEGPGSVGVHVDAAPAGLPLAPAPAANNEYYALGYSFGSVLDLSRMPEGASRTCLGTSDAARVLAQGAGARLGVGLHVSQAALREVFSWSRGDGLCVEMDWRGTLRNWPMHSIGKVRDATAEAQGAGVEGGAGVLLQTGGQAYNRLQAVPIANAFSWCAQRDGRCLADAFGAAARVTGQGAGRGGVGVLLSHGRDDTYDFFAYEPAGAFAVQARGGEAKARSSFGGDARFGPREGPLPVALVQGSASPGPPLHGPQPTPGFGALVDTRGRDTYRGAGLCFIYTTYPAPTLHCWDTHASRLYFIMTDRIAQEFVPGLDLDKGAVEAAPAVALLADLGGKDTYTEGKNPFSGAGDEKAWGRLASASPAFVELGVDRHVPGVVP